MSTFKLSLITAIFLVLGLFKNGSIKTYLNRAKQFPERFVIIDASGSLANTQKQIKAALDSKIK